MKDWIGQVRRVVWNKKIMVVEIALKVSDLQSRFKE